MAYTPVILPYRLVDNDDSMALRSQKNFEEIERLLGQLQIAVNDKEPTWDLSANITGFGDGSDGAFNSTDNVQWTVETEDYTTVIKKFTSFNLNAGHTLTVDKRCRGVFIYCTGNVTISGLINLNYRSAKVQRGDSAQQSIQVPLGTVVVQIPLGRAGGKGGNGGKAGDAGTPYGTGGVPETPETVWFGGGYGTGGGGGVSLLIAGTDHISGDGYISTANYGLAISKGLVNSETGYGDAGNWGGGTGGDGFPTAFSGNGGDYPGGGGGGGGMIVAPGPGGNGLNGSNGNAYGGGLLVVIAKGNVDIGGPSGTGKITCNGGNGGTGGRGYSKAGCGGGGGGGGGGTVYILHGGTLSYATGSIEANGGEGAAGGISTEWDFCSGATGQDGENGIISFKKLTVT